MATRGPKARPVIDRLVDGVIVDDETGCWEWQGFATAAGYGAMIAGSRLDNSVRREYTHRVAWMEFVGPIPDGLQVDHLCRNTICCNPGHLEPVTPRVNTLRSEGTPAINARKTHCNAGHPLSGDNLRVTPSGTRKCIACEREANRLSWLRRSGQLAV